MSHAYGGWMSESVDRPCNIIGNLGNDPKYWNQIHTMKIIKKTIKLIETDTTVGPQNSKSHVIITAWLKRNLYELIHEIMTDGSNSSMK